MRHRVPPYTDSLTLKYPYEAVCLGLCLCVTVPETVERMSIVFSLLKVFSCRSLINPPVQLECSLVEGNTRFLSGTYVWAGSVNGSKFPAKDKISVEQNRLDSVSRQYRIDYGPRRDQH